MNYTISFDDWQFKTATVCSAQQGEHETLLQEGAVDMEGYTEQGGYDALMSINLTKHFKERFRQKGGGCDAWSGDVCQY